MYKQAAHCYEELLLLAPSQLTYSIRYADVMYTIGTAESVSTAQAYYSNAVESSNGTCIRALYGLVLCTTHPKLKKVSFLFRTCYESVFQGSGETPKLRELSVKALIKLYKQEDSPLLKFVQTLLDVECF